MIQEVLDRGSLKSQQRKKYSQVLMAKHTVIKRKSNQRLPQLEAL
jgi:hypothetical protein